MKFNKGVSKSFELIKNASKISATRIWCEIINIFSEVSVTMIARVFLIKIILDLVAERNFAKGAIVIIITASIDLLGSFYKDYMNNYLRPKTDNKISYNINKRLYKFCKSQDIESYDNPTFYDKYIFAAKESAPQTIGCINDYTNLFVMLLQIIISGMIVVWGQPILLVVAIIPTCIYIYLGTMVSTRRVNLSQSIRPLERQYSYSKRVVYLKNHAMEIRSSGIKNLLFKTFDNSIKKLLHTVKSYAKGLNRIYFIQNLVFFMQYTFIIAYLTWRALVIKDISIGDFAMLLAATVTLGGNLRAIGYNINRIVEHGLFAEVFLDFMNKQPSIKAMEPIKQIGHNSLDIRLSNVEFSYSNSKHKIIDGIDMDIKAGEKVAIVGPNGAGKTTLIKLILRLYDPEKGTISTNNTDIVHYDPDDYRSRFSIVFQDYKIYATTIAENILLRQPQSEGEEEIIWNALRMVGLEEKIRLLPKGIYTMITKEFENDGVNLSGGEKQKIAIARAMAYNPQVLILDEPSSALDPIMEKEINDAMLTIMEGRTVIIISHRLATVRNVDRIYLLNNGKVEEVGTHDKLMDSEGRYSEMYKLQASQYCL